MPYLWDPHLPVSVAPLGEGPVKESLVLTGREPASSPSEEGLNVCVARVEVGGQRVADGGTLGTARGAAREAWRDAGSM